MFVSALLITNTLAFQFVTDLLHSTIIRFSVLFTSSGGESVSTRYHLYSQAINMFSENILLGNGLGSFGIYVTGFDVKLYPHNILLELLSEAGIISVFIFSIFILSMFNKIRSNNIVFLVCLYAFFNMMKSNSFEELRMFFGFLAVALLYAQETRPFRAKCSAIAT